MPFPDADPFPKGSAELSEFEPKPVELLPNELLLLVPKALPEVAEEPNGLLVVLELLELLNGDAPPKGFPLFAPKDELPNPLFPPPSAKPELPNPVLPNDDDALLLFVPKEDCPKEELPNDGFPNDDCPNEDCPNEDCPKAEFPNPD